MCPRASTTDSRADSAPEDPQLLLAESAFLQPKLANMPAFMHAPIKEKLANNYRRQRIIMSILALTAPLVHSLYGEWKFIYSFGDLPADSRLLLYLVSVGSASIGCAAAFPLDPTTEAGAKFTVIPVTIGSMLRCFGVVLDLYHTGYIVNDACTLVHRITNTVLFCSWFQGIWLGLNRRFTWKMSRTCHAIDGFAIFLCTLLIRHLGPSTGYPPGAMSFPAALTRGLSALLLGLVGLAPSNRLRIARFATHLGWNHVTMSLEEFSHAKELAEQSGACCSRSHALGTESSYSLDDDEGQGGANDDASAAGSIASRYTAKIVGQPWQPVDAPGSQAE